jgi:hypothetical protein
VSVPIFALSCSGGKKPRPGTGHKIGIYFFDLPATNSPVYDIYIEKGRKGGSYGFSFEASF